MNLVMVLGMFVCMTSLMSLFIFTVSNAFHMPSATVSVRAGGCFWLNHVAMLLFMLCNALSVECFLL